MESPFLNLNFFELQISDPSKFQATHFTFGTIGGEERWEILITVMVSFQEVEN
jgi:hypothetical protein